MMPQDFDGEGGTRHDCGCPTCGYVRPEPQEDEIARDVLGVVSLASAGQGSEGGSPRWHLGREWSVLTPAPDA